jgi:hypothetical protein
MTLSAHLLALKVPTSALSTDLERQDLAKALVALVFAECDKKLGPRKVVVDEWGYEQEISYEPEVA